MIIFTGIIEELGAVKNINRGPHSFQINIAAQKVVEDLKIGDSIAVNGVCLTVTSFSTTHFIADVMPETLNKTNLKELKGGMQVNLERALTLNSRLGGHLVQGHVDAVGTILQKERLDIAIIFSIKAPPEVLKYTVTKGSIAIDGISLTIVDVFEDSFTVSLIPHTAEHTTLGFKEPGVTVNLESDVIGRYVEKLLGSNQSEAKLRTLTTSFLAENGFL